MKFIFECHQCGKRGSQDNTSVKPFVFAYWYTERNGLQHGCLYCRSCGAVHDTVGTLLGGIKLLFGRFPSKVLASFDFDTFLIGLEDGYPIPRIVAKSMIDDERISRNHIYFENEDISF